MTRIVPPSAFVLCADRNEAITHLTLQGIATWGPAARAAETVVAWGEHYGADALIADVIRHAREDLALRGRADYAAQIRSWRAQTGMTLRQFALAAGTSASRLSDYENAKVAPTTDVLGRLSHVALAYASDQR